MFRNTRPSCLHLLDYRSLEARKLLAGNVFVDLVGTSLVVIGNSESNAVAINLNATTPEILVQGQDNTNVRYSDNVFTGSTLNAEISDIFVFANAGDDTVTIDGRSNVTRGELVVSLGHGNDSLYIVGGTFGSDVTVYAGDNDDSIFFDDTSVLEDLALIAGSGADVAGLDAVQVTGQTRFFGQFGHDSLLISDSSFNDGVYLEMGDGADRFETLDSSYLNRISVRGRNGFDTTMLEDTNSFAFGSNRQTIELQITTPNADGGTADPMSQLKRSLLKFGSELRGFTADTFEVEITEFVEDFSLPLAELEVDEVSQLVTASDISPTISATWDQAVQNAVIATAPGPTIASRAYAMMHTAMYNAWSAYDETATSTVLADTLQRPQSENTDQNKEVAMSFAAYRVLEDLFASQQESFDAIMEQLGFSTLNTSTDVTTPAGIGNRMAAAILEVRVDDGSNQEGGYADISGYTPGNTVGATVDIDLWTPEYVPIDSNAATADRVQEFLTPHWGEVEPFSLSSGSEFRPVAPEPFLLVDGTVNLEAKTITLADNSVVAIDQSIVGTVINPAFIAQAEEVVEISAGLTDEQKLIAEFWEDGGGTSFPPGTFMTFGQFVSARDNHGIDQDAQMFFALGNAVFDAGIATWEAKVYYDYARPVRVIRELGELGLIGEYDSLTDSYLIEAWTPDAGTQRIQATEFLTYQTPGSDPSPPFAEYTSGHSAFSASGAKVLELFTGSDVFGASITFSAGSSRFEPGTTPASDLTLSWDTFSEAADEGGISRLYGGIHFSDGDVNGRTLGDSVGQSAFDRAQEYINGTA